MSERDNYPSGVPCWVEVLTPDPKAALGFYGALFDWEYMGPGPMASHPQGQYYVAQVRGRDVAGIGCLPDTYTPPGWATHIRVENSDQASQRAKSAGGSILKESFDVPPVGRMAVLADPMGAVFCVWEARGREGARVINESRAWAMSLLHTTDPERSKAFYGAVFGWQTAPFGPPQCQADLWRLPGYVGGLPSQPVPRDVVGVMVPVEGGAPPHWSVDFWVDDADATAKHAAGLGGRVIVAPHDMPGFRNAVLADPQGPIFSVSQLTRGR
jgi:uncharacterized protein